MIIQRSGTDGAKFMKIAVAGAGSIGCFVGGVLAQTGHDVCFLGRKRIVEAAEAEGLRLTDFAGLDAHLTGLPFSEDPAIMAGAEIVLVCVKSAGTAEMAAEIARHVSPDALVISLQNGVRNAEVLRAALPGWDVRAAMVPFNVVPKGTVAYHRGTSGNILVQEGPLPDLSTRAVTWESVPNIEGIQWGKLLINLGNAINALSDIPLRDMLHDRAWRRLMADQMVEALGIVRAAGITPVKAAAAPPAVLAMILRLPNFLFKRIAAQMLTVDAEARSSMWDDLTQRRPTEVDALQGEIIRLAEGLGRTAPVNTRLLEMIKAAEAAGNGPPGVSVRDIRPR